MNTRLFRTIVAVVSIALLVPAGASAMAPQAPPASLAAPIAPDQAQIQTALRSSSLLFVQNSGQFDPQVRFQLRGPSGAWWFTDQAIWLTVLAPDASGPDRASRMRRPDHHAAQRGANLRFTIDGLAPDARQVADHPLPGRTNYMTGNDASRWHSDVPLYGSVTWQDVAPGVSLALRRSAGDLELAITAAPGADLSRLRLRVEGADALRVDGDRAVADTAAGTVPLPRLALADGTALRPVVDGDRLAVEPASPRNDVGAGRPRPGATPDSNPAQLLLGTYLGASFFEEGNGVTTGIDGSIYVAGDTGSFDFPTTPGAFDTGFNGNYDAFVTKLDPLGANLVYSTFLGGSGVSGFGDGAFTLRVDSTGAAYVVGWTDSTDFPTTIGAFDTSFNGGVLDGFVTKLNAAGNGLVYSTFLGGNGLSDYGDAALAIAVLNNGTAIVAGYTDSTNFPTSPSAFDKVYNGGVSDSFVAKLNAAGSGLSYSTFLGGSGTDTLGEDVYALAVAADGSAYVTGTTDSADYPTTVGAFDTTFAGAIDDGFVTGLNSTGSALVYSAFLGGNGPFEFGEGGEAIAVGSDGSVYVGGVTDASDFPTTPGAFDTTFAGTLDGTVTKVNPGGGSLGYSTFLGGSSDEALFGVALGADNTVYVSGWTDSLDYPVTGNGFQTVYQGGTSDTFLSRLNATGSSLLYSTFVGGNADDINFALAFGGDGAPVLTGWTDSTNFPTTPGAFQTTFAGNTDVYVARLNPGLPVMRVAGIIPFWVPSGTSFRVGAHIAIQDLTGQGIAGAAVTVRFTLPDASQVTVTKTTDSNGFIVPTTTSALHGTYTIEVLNASKTGIVYDRAQNVQSSASVTVP